MMTMKSIAYTLSRLRAFVPFSFEDIISYILARPIHKANRFTGILWHL